MNKSPIYPDNPPKLIPSLMCYVDILGFSQLSIESLTAKRGDQFLQKLRNALRKAYERVRNKSKTFMDMGDEYFSIKIFTDNIIVGYPLKNFKLSYAEAELGDIFNVFSEFQVGLAMEGFLVRGGIAFGLHYMDDEVVFGEALLEAVAQDKAGGPPRITLAPSAVKILQHHLGYYGDTRWSPQYQVLLEDSDGLIFLNYLEDAFMAFPDGGVFFEVFSAHKDTIVNGLKKYRSNPDVRAKYEWAARYHNFICQEFLEKHPIPTDPDTDEVYAAAIIEAQKLSDYYINIESFAAVPCRIKLTPISPPCHGN